MNQDTINQRLKFLVNQIGLSSRAFSEIIGESPTNTHNYIGARQAEPRASYLAKVLSHFSDVNPSWLMLGEGEPFKEGSTPTQNQANISGKKNTVAVAGTNNGTATTNNYPISDCEKERDAYKSQLDKAQQHIEHLQAQLVTKDALIAAKEESLDILKAAFNRPN
jgi:hypothetical protein